VVLGASVLVYNALKIVIGVFNMTQLSEYRNLSKRSLIALSAGFLSILLFPTLALGRILGIWDSPLFLIGITFFITIISMATALIMGTKEILNRGNLPWNDMNVRIPFVSIVLGGAVAIPVLHFIYLGFTSPPIHDISTDTANPPKFVSVLPERIETNAKNSADYNPTIAKMQNEGYPDIKPLNLPLPVNQAFRQALEAVYSMDWRLVAAVPEEGRIEAVDITFWSGFIDDIVIRVTPNGASQSRIDVRSLSRVGGSDLGKNANRIRDYLNHLP
tara:strand:+ start:1113 stop:1934 length:822 start_codon:yes stop_codon:yes gene_type:complete